MDKDRVAAAPLRTEEDDNGDDKMAVEERTSAESKEKLAVSDVEMKEANEPANKSKSDAEISKWEEKVCLNTFGVCLYSYILFVYNFCLIIFSFSCILSD